ncbi:MAG: metal-dependent hydrolase [Nanoarchaeota archaeon]|nr:metal-dependent hydrolase [Nanoarchaeota archaeon]
MPDWMSHILIGLIIVDIFNIRKKSLVLLGALLPDLIAKFFLLFFYLGLSIKGISVGSFHTPVMCFLLSILIAPLFKYNRLKTIFILNIGLLTHFLSDITMRHFTSGTRLFFPFSMQSYRIDLLWPEQSIYVLFLSFIIYIFIRIIKKFYISRSEI